MREMNDGEIFNVVTNGRRSMPPYKYPGGRSRSLGHCRLRSRAAALYGSDRE